MIESRLNILFLGGSKRVSMATKFIMAGMEAGVEVAIFGYELSETEPLSSVGTVFRGQKWSSPTILEDLHRIVEREEIKIMIPFVDAAVEVAARYRDEYGDVFVPVGSAGSAALMFDKVAAAGAFAKAGLAIPATVTPDSLRFPLIAKPRHGSASKGIVVIADESQWEREDQVADDYLLQEFIADAAEYTVDCYRSVETGKVEIVSPRKRLEVSGGEVMSTVTVDRPDIVCLASDTMRAMNLRGAVTVQVLEEPATGRIMLMEVNPRLGGGAVATVHAGANLPLAIICEALGRPAPDALNARAGILIKRYLNEVAFDINEK